MIAVKFRMPDIERMTHKVGGAKDQLPFVMAGLLNDGAFKARQVLVTQTWPRGVTVRNAAFMNAALTVDKATKANLRVEIYDKLGRANLQLHAKGGIKTPRGRNLALPLPGSVTYGPRGIPLRQRPKGIIARTPKRALRITAGGIFVGEHGRLRLKYSFKPSAAIKADVPFYQDFEYVMRESLRTGFADAMAKAMKTRR